MSSVRYGDSRAILATCQRECQSEYFAPEKLQIIIIFDSTQELNKFNRNFGHCLHSFQFWLKTRTECETNADVSTSIPNYK